MRVLENSIAGLRRSASRFVADRSGNFAITFAAMSAALLLTVGYAINTAQLYNAKSALGQALDSAITSTARDLTLGKITEDQAEGLIEAFMSTNIGNVFAKEDRLTLTGLKIDRVNKTVSAAAKVDVVLAFPIFGPGRSEPVVAQSAALYSDKKIEIAMMLDTTGSMSGQKIRDLKLAATNAVDSVFANDNELDPRVRISIVPYAAAVNVGALAPNVVFDEESVGGLDVPPTDYRPARADDNCATERKTKDGNADLSADGPFTGRLDDRNRPYIARINRDDRLRSCPGASVIPLSANAAKLKREIDKFNASGTTAGAIGIQWAAYMLSPDWRSAISAAGLGDGPSDHDEKKVSKVAILMTDGLFNTAFAGVGSRENTTSADAKSREHALGLCSRMKLDGIGVFTIGFDLDNRSINGTDRRNAKSTLQNCASPDTPKIRHFYDVSTGPELEAAFKEIIRNTEVLALTQ